MIQGIVRHVLIVVALVTASACADAGLMSTEDGELPLPPGPGPLAVVTGMIVRDDGMCIDSASVRVVQGQALDRSAAQRTPCDGPAGTGGFVLNDLTPGLPMTIRATAPGYLSLDKTITPAPPPQPLVVFALQKLNDAAAIRSR